MSNMGRRIKLAKGIFIEARDLVFDNSGRAGAECTVGEHGTVGWHVIQVGGQKFSGVLGEHAVSGLVRWTPTIGQSVEMKGQRVVASIPPICSKSFPLSFRLTATHPGTEQCEVVNNGELADSAALPLGLRIVSTALPATVVGTPPASSTCSSDAIIKALHQMVERRPLPPGKYEDQFREGGIRRAAEIAGILSDRWQERNGPAVYVTVGGADGSEAAEALNTAWIVAAVNIEPAQISADQSRLRGNEAEARLGKKLYTIQARASDCQSTGSDFANLLARIRGETGASTIVVSFKSVLHELPKRDPNFVVDVFLHACNYEFAQIAIAIHEPVFPLEWRGSSAMMYIASKSYAIGDLYALSQAVWNKHHRGEPEPQIAINDRIRLSRKTAADVIVKTMFVENLSYEMEESIGDFTRERMERILGGKFHVLDADAKSSINYRRRADQIGMELYSDIDNAAEAFPMFFERVIWVRR